ncbi:MAG: ABC transporter ATP-binding protein [Elusimicrobiaceae bacterium]|nr:ABC transporter ATP-binding protein [Elusimicrobiaceae bacterium]
MADPILKVTDLYKSYPQAHGGAVHVLENISLELAAGQFAVLLGPSGSGKSTLLNIIGLLDTPDSGSVEIAGEPVLNFTEAEKSRFRSGKTGFVFQFDSLLQEFTMLENVDMPALIAGRPDHAKTLALLARFGLEQLADKFPAQLSGGERQRAAVARSLRNSPVLVLADEPTGNLDYENASVVYNDFRKLADQGVAVLMVTHNPEAASYADRVFRLARTRLQEDPRRTPQ